MIRWPLFFFFYLFSLVLYFTPMARADSYREDVKEAHLAFLKSLNESYELINQYEYITAFAMADLAQIYSEYLVVLVGNYSSPKEKWQITVSTQIDLIDLYMTIGTRSYDTRQYTNSLKAINAAISINKYLPVPRYEKALTLLAMKKEWDATVQLYEAKRLNAYPAKRKMVDPLDKEHYYGFNREIILNEKIDNLLIKLKKSTSYPVNLNLKTGKKYELRLIPGIGANIRRDDKSVSFNLYINDPESKVLDKLGIPDHKEELTVENNVSLLFYDKCFCVIGINRDNVIERIQVNVKGYSADIDGNTVSVGNHASTVFKALGEAHDFERTDVREGGFRELLRYNALGLTFAVTNSDQIGSISIWKLE